MDCSTCDARMKEIYRLRGVARDYSLFYQTVKNAFANQSWEEVSRALEDHS